MKSAFPVITSCVIFVTLSLTSTVILSKLPLGIPGRSNFGFLVSTYSRVKSTMSRVYGPTPGGGCLRLLPGDLAAGVGDTYGSARANRTFVSGSVRLIVISPVLSFVSMPAMSPLKSPFSWNSAAPRRSRGKNDDQTLPSLSSRFMVFSKSLALTGVPSL